MCIFAITKTLKMEKLELKHLAPYLPYGLKVLRIFNHEIMLFHGLSGKHTIEALDLDDLEMCALLAYGDCQIDEDEEFKPILRPLSDLTKEIEVNGENFVPLEVLGKLYEKNGTFEDGVFGWDSSTGGDDYQDYYYVVQKELTYSVYIGNPNDSYSYPVFTESLHYDIIQKLYEWHFDIHGLIEKELAIDINTLNLKP